MFNLAVCKMKVVRRMVKGGKNGQCKMLIEELFSEARKLFGEVVKRDVKN